MRILNSCVVSQYSILQTGVCVSQSSRTLSMPTALIRRGISAASFAVVCFAVVNCSDPVMSLFYLYVLTLCLIFLQL